MCIYSIKSERARRADTKPVWSRMKDRGDTTRARGSFRRLRKRLARGLHNSQHSHLLGSLLSTQCINATVSRCFKCSMAHTHRTINMYVLLYTFCVPKYIDRRALLYIGALFYAIHSYNHKIAASATMTQAKCISFFDTTAATLNHLQCAADCVCMCERRCIIAPARFADLGRSVDYARVLDATSATNNATFHIAL